MSFIRYFRSILLITVSVNVLSCNCKGAGESIPRTSAIIDESLLQKNELLSNLPVSKFNFDIHQGQDGSSGSGLRQDEQIDWTDSMSRFRRTPSFGNVGSFDDDEKLEQQEKINLRRGNLALMEYILRNYNPGPLNLDGKKRFYVNSSKRQPSYSRQCFFNPITCF